MNTEEKTKTSQQQEPSLPPLVKIQESFKIIIPEEVESKIRHLCSKISQVEWSGTLFYTYEGNWNDGSLVIICKDIYIMDIGTGGYTEFDVHPGVVTYMCENPELLDCQMGLIH